MATLKGSAANPAETNRPSGDERAVPSGDRRNGYGDRSDRPARTAGSRITGLAAVTRGGVTRRGVSESLGELAALFTEIVKDTPAWGAAMDIRIIPLDHNVVRSLKISSIILAVRDKGAPELGVAVHNMIVAASLPSIPAKREKIDGIDVQIIRTADNGDDTLMGEVVEQQVAAAFPGVKQLLVPTETIATTLNIRDRDQVERMLKAAMLGCTTFITEQAGDTTMHSLSDVVGELRFTATASFDPVELVNDVQHPVRADWSIVLAQASREVNNDKLGLNDSGEESDNVLSVHGYNDIAWVGILEDDDAPRGREPTARYVPKVIATAINTGNFGYMGIVGLAAALLNLMRTNLNWMKAMPLAKTGSMNDYGILSMETSMNPDDERDLAPTRFKSDDEGREMHRLFLQRMVYNKPNICIDVPLCGPESWQLGFLLDIANDDGGTRADFIKAMNEATDGKFGDNIDANDPLFRVQTELLLGTYHRADTVLRDIRDGSYVAVANWGLPNGNGPNNVLQQWSNAWNDSETDINILHQERLRILTEMFGPINVTGKAMRIECTKGLLDGLAMAMKATKFQPLLQGFQSSMDGWNRTAFSGYTMGAGHASEAFNRGRLSSDRESRGDRYGSRQGGYGGRRSYR